MRYKFRKDKQKKTIHFLIRLILLSIPLYLIIIFNISLYPLQVAVANNIEGMIGFFNLPFYSEDITFFSEGKELFVFQITEDCTGWKSMIFFFALLFAVPGIVVKKRLIGLIIGIPLIYIMNIIRISFIIFIQQWFGSEFAMFLHAFFWQAAMIVFVLFIWVIWMLVSKKNLYS